MPSRCGRSTCTPQTCATLGASCGPVADGCGGTLDCGTCTRMGETCGGAGTPSVCGKPCVGLCPRQVTCPFGGTTRLSGIVRAPTPAIYGAADPLPGALVYVPNAPVLPFADGVTCDRCSANVSGSPLVRTTTGADGRFTLDNVPVGANVPLVIQLGRWRRQIMIPNVAGCRDNALGAEQTRLPRTKAEGDIPHVAMVTGAVDALECVLLKIGIDRSEFTNPGGNGRVHLYHAPYQTTWSEVGGGAVLDAATPEDDGLLGDVAQLAAYDMVALACEGDQFAKSTAARENLLAYADRGGRVFTTHYGYTWIYETQPWSATGLWDPDPPTPTGGVSHGPPDPLRALIDTTFPKGLQFLQWLTGIGATSTATTVDIHVPRNDLDAVNSPAQRWIYTAAPRTIQHSTFNTPLGAPAAQQCGRVLFSDFHVTSSTSRHAVFPGHCSTAPLTPQEKILEYMIFDLTNCVTPDVPPPCQPRTCAQANASCGPVGDGCGGLLQCGTCTAPATCGGGGVPSQCGTPTCTRQTCAAQGLACGPAGDGCGGVLDCGPCTAPDTCGGGGVPGQCGHTTSCMPRTCAAQSLECGPAGDGCGNLLQCGECPPGQTCGAVTPGRCGTRPCVPRTCQMAGADCGLVGDGCGGTIDCGVCNPPDTCGGNGFANVCGRIG